MFGLSKKKKSDAAAGEQIIGLTAEALDLDKEIIVHAMPPRFRASHPGSGQAKKTGLLILILGMLFLVAVAGGAYYFLFLAEAPAAPTATTTPALETANTEPEPAVVETVPEKTEIINPPAATSTIIATTTPPEAVATTTATTTEPAVKSLTKAVDSDKDGLTDIEEGVLGTDPAAADSDGDGYSDLAELNNFYDPAGPGKLADSPRWKKYLNPTYGYSLLRPEIFAPKPLGGDYSVSFVAPDNQFFQLEVQPNTTRSSIMDWYREQFGEPAELARLVEGRDASGAPSWLGIKSGDGLNLYLTDTKFSNIFTLSYNVGLERTLAYPNFFNLFITSLEFTK
jgi:hypothetical protein